MDEQTYSQIDLQTDKETILTHRVFLYVKIVKGFRESYTVTDILIIWTKKGEGEARQKRRRSGKKINVK